MKLDPETLVVLKNFAKINNSIFIEKNSGELKTISPSKNILAVYSECQSFDVDVCLYDLSKFINALSNNENDNIEFFEQYLEIGGKTKIWYAEPEIIIYPNKAINMPNIHVTLDLSENDIDEIIKFSGIMGLNEVQITQEKNDIVVRLQDSKSPCSNTHMVTRQSAGLDENNTFNYYFNVENLKMISGDYHVKLTEKIISQFDHKSMNISYWIAMNSSSQAPTTSKPVPAPEESDDTPF